MDMILSESEINRIYQNLLSKDHRKCFAIARYTGLSFGSIVRLKVQDVYVDASTPRKQIETHLIDGKIHLIPVCSFLEVNLIKYRLEEFVIDSWLFPSPFWKERHISVSSIDKFFRAAVVKAELDDRGISPSDLRRSYMASLGRSGLSNEAIAKLIGKNKFTGHAKHIKNQPVDLQEVLSRVFGGGL